MNVMFVAVREADVATFRMQQFKMYFVFGYSKVVCTGMTPAKAS
jgi:hypothetical protein